MTTRPRIHGDPKVHGLLAVALFVVLSAVFLAAEFDAPAGFAEVESITAAIGFAMFSIDAAVIPDGTEGFLVPFEIIDVVLVAALVAAVMLARREDGSVLEIAGDGGSSEAADDGGETDREADR